MDRLNTTFGFFLDCDCYYRSNKGLDYVGDTSTSVTGRPCKNWIDVYGNVSWVKFPGGESVEEARNYCRNLWEFNDSPWCFEDISGPMTPCSVAVCYDEEGKLDFRILK